MFEKIAFRIKRKIGVLFGYDFYMETDDRRVLETIIFPYFVNENGFENILFVGCAWYTLGYNKKFKDKNYWTLEIDPRKKKYGSKQHIIDPMENVGLHFKPNELDLIVCNGVFGWGLDAKDDVEKAFQGCFDSLREGGILVIGWNDMERSRPMPLEDVQSLQLFERHVFPPLATEKYLTANPNKHIYSFYIKPRATAS